MPAVACTRVIDRIVFLFHPACWAMAETPDSEYLATYGVRHSWWYAARNRERRIVALQKEFISAMRPNELLYLHESDGFLATEFNLTFDREAVSVTGTCVGERVDPQRHTMGTAVKAATYHQLEVSGNGEWRIRVVLDV